MLQKAVKFDEEWFDWSEDKIKQYIEANSGNNFTLVMYMYYELGKDEKWFKRQIKELEGDMLIVKREILLEWTFASSLSIFSEEQLDNLSQYVKKEYNNKIYIGNYKIDVIEEFNNLQAKNWCLSIDIGGGLGRDYSAFNLIDPASLKPVMIFKNNQISVLDFADLVIEFVKIYVPNAVIIPERNSIGNPFIERIEKSEVGKNLYYTSNNDVDVTTKVINEESMFKKKSKGVFKEKRTFGFNTTNKTREVMTKEILYMIVNQRPELCNNKEVFEEMRKLIRERNGKINHMQGEHDDLLMSYLMGLHVLLYDPKSHSRFFKNISNEPVVGDKNTERTRTGRNFEVVAQMNNTQRLNSSISERNNKLYQELFKQQELINQKDKKITSSKTRNLNAISKLNKLY